MSATMKNTDLDSVARVASVALILGALITGAANLLHPRGSDRTLDDVEPLLQIINDVGVTYWKVDHFALIVGVWLLGVGWFGLRRSIAHTPGEPWASLGFYGVVAGTALWTAVFVMDMNVGLVAARWYNAVGEPTKPMWVAAASAVSSLSFELDAAAQILYWLCWSLFGIGMVNSGTYPRWLGWAAIVIAVISIAVAGLPQFFSGPSNAITNAAFPALASLMLAWLLVVGVWMARGAWRKNITA